MVNLQQYPPLTKKCQLHIMGMDYTHTIKKLLFVKIVEDFPFHLSLYFVNGLISDETLHF